MINDVDQPKRRSKIDFSSFFIANRNYVCVCFLYQTSNFFSHEKNAFLNKTPPPPCIIRKCRPSTIPRSWKLYRSQYPRFIPKCIAGSVLKDGVGCLGDSESAASWSRKVAFRFRLSSPALGRSMPIGSFTFAAWITVAELRRFRPANCILGSKLIKIMACSSIPGVSAE